jgi:hypothetical protein
MEPDVGSVNPVPDMQEPGSVPATEEEEEGRVLMDDTTKTLADAADHLEAKAYRAAFSQPPQSLVHVLGPESALALVRLLRAESRDAAMCDDINSRDPDNDGKTRVLLREQTAHALALAEGILKLKERNSE